MTNEHAAQPARRNVGLLIRKYLTYFPLIGFLVTLVIALVLESTTGRSPRSRWGSSGLSASAAFCSAVRTCSRQRRWRRPSAGLPAASSGKSVWRAWGTELQA